VLVRHEKRPIGRQNNAEVKKQSYVKQFRWPRTANNPRKPDPIRSADFYYTPANLGKNGTFCLWNNGTHKKSPTKKWRGFPSCLQLTLTAGFRQ
jgi:hypothetical protein